MSRVDMHDDTRRIPVDPFILIRFNAIAMQNKRNNCPKPTARLASVSHTQTRPRLVYMKTKTLDMDRTTPSNALDLIRPAASDWFWAAPG